MVFHQTVINCFFTRCHIIGIISFLMNFYFNSFYINVVFYLYTTNNIKFVFTVKYI